jgi:two-component system response regulator NreC
MAIRVLLAEDHTIVREGLRALLARSPTVAVVGEAADGRAAIAEALRLRPDVVVMDLTMPDVDGVEATRAIAARLPGTAVLVLSMHGDAEHVGPAMRAGARGYLVKGVGLGELVAAIEAVAAGAQYLGRGVDDALQARAAHPPSVEERSLTPREREVLTRVAQGLSSGEIAAQMDVSVKTVETHRANLLQKLAVPNVAALVRKALRLGLIPLDD